MIAVKSLAGLALTGSAGMVLLILACTLGHTQNWWPASVVVFLLMSPFPILVARHMSSSEPIGFSNPSSGPREWAYFLTSGIVVSALALPLVMAHVGTITNGAVVLSLISSVFFLFTILAIFMVFQSEDTYSSAAY